MAHSRESVVIYVAVCLVVGFSFFCNVCAFVLGCLVFCVSVFVGGAFFVRFCAFLCVFVRFRAFFVRFCWCFFCAFCALLRVVCGSGGFFFRILAVAYFRVLIWFPCLLLRAHLPRHYVSKGEFRYDPGTSWGVRWVDIRIVGRGARPQNALAPSAKYVARSVASGYWSPCVGGNFLAMPRPFFSTFSPILGVRVPNIGPPLWRKRVFSRRSDDGALFRYRGRCRGPFRSTR